MKENIALGEMVDSKSRKGKEQGKPRSYLTGKKGSFQRLVETCPKDSEANLKGLPLTKNNNFSG